VDAHLKLRLSRLLLPVARLATFGLTAILLFSLLRATAVGVADDDFQDDMDGSNSIMMMGLDESSSRIEALRGEGSTPGRSSAHGSMQLTGEAAASLLQAPGRGGSLGMEGGADGGVRASMGGYGDGAYDDGGGGGGFGDDDGGGDYMAGFGDMDASGDFGITMDGSAATPGSSAALGRSATLEEAVPGGLATAEALMVRRRQGVEDDEAGGAGAEDAGASAKRREDAAVMARERAATRRRNRQAKRAKMAMGDVVLSSDTYRQWLADASSTVMPASGPALALRRLELSCGRAEDLTRPSGGLIRPKRSEAAVSDALSRSAVAGPSTTPLLMSDDVLALLSAASSAGLASRTSKLTQAQAVSAKRFLAKKLRAEADRRGGRSGAILTGPQAQASASSSASAASSSSSSAGGAGAGLGDGYDGGGDDGGGGMMDDDDGFMGGFGDIDASGYGDGAAYGGGAYDGASDAGAGAGGAAASISGTDLPNDEDDGGDTESLLGGVAGRASSAESALLHGSATSGRGSMGVGVVADSSTGAEEEAIPEEVWARGRAADASRGAVENASGAVELPRMNGRTAKMLGVLEAEFQKRDEASSDPARTTLRLQELIGPHKRRTAAVAFYEALVLKNADIVDMVQTRPYGAIAVRRAPRFDEGAEQAAATQAASL
jgi:hypothetical protein